MKNAFKAMVAMVSLVLATTAYSESISSGFSWHEVVEGVTWYYETYSSGGSTCARIISGADKYTGDLTVPTTLGGCPVKEIGNNAFFRCTALKSVVIQKGVTSIGNYAFEWCSGMTSVTIPEGVTSIGECAFSYCSGLTNVTIPEGVMSIGECAFWCCSGLKSVQFLGAPPSELSDGDLLYYAEFAYPREYGAAWIRYFGGLNQFRKFNREPVRVEVLSSKIRANDPTILDVVYKVTSSKPTVKVRALAFEDGERSFAKVVRPETFVADTNGVATAANVGDEVVPNVEHTLSWKVSSDWSNQLAKVKFEVLACDENLLPLEVRTIPVSDKYGKMDVTWNAISEDQWFDALLWLYADKNDKVKLSGGVCYYDSNVVAGGDWIDSHAAPVAVYDAMGYNLLTGAELNYVNEETRLGLSPSGARQYGWKIVDK